MKITNADHRHRPASCKYASDDFTSKNNSESRPISSHVTVDVYILQERPRIYPTIYMMSARRPHFCCVVIPGLTLSHYHKVQPIVYGRFLKSNVPAAELYSFNVSIGLFLAISLA